MQFSRKFSVKDSSISLLILRIGVGIVLLPHGLQKLLGVFGGHGPSETMQLWEAWWGVPSGLTLLVIIVESFGVLSLMFGFLTRMFAFLLICIMTVAVYLVHWQHGFFMNWYAKPGVGEGFEYHILVFAILLVLIIFGGGRLSLDKRFMPFA